MPILQWKTESSFKLSSKYQILKQTDKAKTNFIIDPKTLFRNDLKSLRKAELAKLNLERLQIRL